MTVDNKKTDTGGSTMAAPTGRWNTERMIGVARITQQELKDHPEILKQELERLERRAIQEYEAIGVEVKTERVRTRLLNLIDGEPWDGPTRDIAKIIAERVLATGAAQREIPLYPLDEIIIACNSRFRDNSNGDGEEPAEDTGEHQKIVSPPVTLAWVCRAVMYHKESFIPAKVGIGPIAFCGLILDRLFGDGRLAWVGREASAKFFGVSERTISNWVGALDEVNMLDRVKLESPPECLAAGIADEIAELRRSGRLRKRQGTIYVVRLPHEWDWKELQGEMPEGIKELLEKQRERFLASLGGHVGQGK